MYATPRHSSNKFGFALGLQYILRGVLRIFTHCKDNNLSLITHKIKETFSKYLADSEFDDKNLSP